MANLDSYDDVAFDYHCYHMRCGVVAPECTALSLFSSIYQYYHGYASLGHIMPFTFGLSRRVVYNRNNSAVVCQHNVLSVLCCSPLLELSAVLGKMAADTSLLDGGRCVISIHKPSLLHHRLMITRKMAAGRPQLFVLQ